MPTSSTRVRSGGLGALEQITFNNFDVDPSVDLTAGGDGRMWWTLPMTNRIGYIDSLCFLPLNLANGTPNGLARGEDDSIWFADGLGNRIGRITHFKLPVESAPTAIIGRSDGRLYVALPRASQILYTDLAAAEPTHTVTPTATVTRTRTSMRTATATLTVPPGSTATARCASTT